MGWLFARHLRPFVLLAGAASLAHASDVDGNAVLDLGGEHVTLENVSVASLHSDDFLLGS